MNRAFTLIETLIYLAIFAIAIGGLSEAAWALLESADRNQTQAMMQEEGDFLIAKINNTISNAESISSPTENNLSSQFIAQEFDDTQVVLQLSNGNLTDNGTVLNNTNVTVRYLAFIRTDKTIEAGIMLSAKTSGGSNIVWSASTTQIISP